MNCKGPYVLGLIILVLSPVIISINSVSGSLEVETPSLILNGHSADVVSVSWSPDGSKIASGSYDSTSMIWDSLSGEVIDSFPSPEGCVLDVAWSPDSTKFAVASYEVVKVWNLLTGQTDVTFTNHTNYVTCSDWSFDGERIATGGADNLIKVWDAATGRELGSMDNHTNTVLSVAWSPDSERLASGSEDNTVRIWNATNFQLLSVFSGHTGTVNGVSWSPDCARVASCSTDNVMMIWDVKTQ